MVHAVLYWPKIKCLRLGNHDETRQWVQAFNHSMRWAAFKLKSFTQSVCVISPKKGTCFLRAVFNSLRFIRSFLMKEVELEIYLRTVRLPEMGSILL
jgi:hypothetical protein